MLYVLSGDHSFIFEPSSTNPGGTRFLNSEIFLRANTVLMRLIPPTKMFQDFCERFKARVESTVKSGLKTENQQEPGGAGNNA
jgi:hypothetical protein